MDRTIPLPYRAALFFAMTIAIVTTAGCNGVRRRLTITSNPPGATVYINDREVGQTPISQNFVYSGTYKIRLSKEGMETKTIMHEVKTPWYLWPGIDFVSENFVAGELRDHQTCHVELTGKRVIPDNELFENASAMRSEAHNKADLIHYQGTSQQQNITTAPAATTPAATTPAATTPAATTPGTTPNTPATAPLPAQAPPLPTTPAQNIQEPKPQIILPPRVDVDHSGNNKTAQKSSDDSRQVR